MGRFDFSFGHHVESTINSDSIDPCSELRARLEAFEALVSTQESFLHNLVRVGFIAGDAEGHTEDALAMTGDQPAVGFLISGEDCPDYRVVVLFHSAD